MTIGDFPAVEESFPGSGAAHRPGTAYVAPGEPGAARAGSSTRPPEPRNDGSEPDGRRIGAIADSFGVLPNPTSSAW